MLPASITSLLVSCVQLKPNCQKKISKVFPQNHRKVKPECFIMLQVSICLGRFFCFSFVKTMCLFSTTTTTLLELGKHHGLV